LNARAFAAFGHIPGIGPSMAMDLWRLGLRRADDLKNRNAETLYEKLCDLDGRRLDRCVLYAFRCAVYYVSRQKHDPKLLKWWSWKEPGCNPRLPRGPKP